MNHERFRCLYPIPRTAILLFYGMKQVEFCKKIKRVWQHIPHANFPIKVDKKRHLWYNDMRIAMSAGKDRDLIF